MSQTIDSGKIAPAALSWLQKETSLPEMSAKEAIEMLLYQMLVDPDTALAIGAILDEWKGWSDGGAMTKANLKFVMETQVAFAYAILVVDIIKGVEEIVEESLAAHMQACCCSTRARTHDQARKLSNQLTCGGFGDQGRGGGRGGGCGDRGGHGGRGQGGGSIEVFSLPGEPIPIPDAQVTKMGGDLVKNKSAGSDAGNFPCRSGYGTQGVKIILRTNFLELVPAPDLVLHRYHVDVQ